MAENNFYLELLNNSNLANISNEEKEMMQIKLWTLLGNVTERYTMGDSSSVPVEIAEELLKMQGQVLDRDTKGYIEGADINYYDEQGNKIENIFLLNKQLQNGIR